MDLKDLVNERAAIHNAAKALALDPSVDDLVSKQCEAISRVSQNPRHWEFVVAASGFMQSRGETGAITISNVLDRISAEPVPAKAYFDAVTTLSIDQALTVGIEVAQIPNWMQVDVMHVLYKGQDCQDECRDKPDKGECLVKCLGLKASVET